MQSQALPIDWIFQPSRWQPARRLADWLRHWAAGQLERREAPRKTAANLAADYWDGTAAAAAARHVVRDVSTSGAFIFAAFQWPRGTIVRMTLQLEEPVRGHRPPAPMLVQTKVVRCEPDGLGVQFLDLSKMERQRLMDLLKSIP
jgi:PilZ domain-containing protein